MKKYILLAQPEEDFPEQLNSHMLFVMEIIFLAKKLGRVFVLPYLHSHPRNPAASEAGIVNYEKLVIGKRIDPMRVFYDTGKLSNYVETISFEDFQKISGNLISCLYTFGKSYNDYIDIYDKRFSFQQSRKLNNIYETPDTNLPFIVLTGCRRRQNGFNKSPNWHNDPTMDYWQIRRNIGFNKDLVDIARDFVKNNLKERYLAIHWRRGDKINPDFGQDSEIIINDEKKMKKALNYYLIRPAKKMMRKYNLSKVFMATNCGTPWHMEYLKKYLPIIQYPETKNWEEMQRMSIVEQIICTNSDFYFSSPYRYEKCSSFSRWIIDERIIMGKGENVAYQKKMEEIKGIKSFFKRTLWRLSKNFKKYPKI